MNPKDLSEGKSIVDYLVGETDGGLDFTFDATGNVGVILSLRYSCAQIRMKVGVMRNALEACHKGWGVCNVIGVAPAGAEIATRPYVALEHVEDSADSGLCAASNLLPDGHGKAPPSGVLKAVPRYQVSSRVCESWYIWVWLMHVARLSERNTLGRRVCLAPPGLG